MRAGGESGGGLDGFAKIGKPVFNIREEQPADHDQIEAVNRTAFGGDLEAKLVYRLRSERLVIASLVAVQDDQVVGHILFSGVVIETERGAVKCGLIGSDGGLAGIPKTRDRFGVGEERSPGVPGTRQADRDRLR